MMDQLSSKEKLAGPFRFPAAALIGAAFLAGCGTVTVHCPDAETREEADTSSDAGPEADTGREAESPPDAGPDDAADADGPAPPSCPAPIAESCPEEAPYLHDPVPVMMQASDLGPGTRFVDVSPGLVVLAERDEGGGSRTVLLLLLAEPYEDPATAGRAELTLPAGSTLQPVAAARRGVDSAGTALPELVALLCDGAACALYGADAADPGEVFDLSQVPGGEVPASAGMRGLWWDVGPAACAYGDGIHCFDGREWSSVVPSDPGAPQFNDMETCMSFTVAVGGNGRTAMSAWPSWTVESGEIYPDLLTVTCDGDAIIRAGEGGTIMDDSWIPCSAADEDIVFIDSGDLNFYDAILGVTSSGRVFIGRQPLSPDSGLCYTGQTLGPLVAATAEYCGILYYYFFLTANTLYGETGDCPID
jgi:hypothetical protein